jgi:iron complex outermembrane receptor protein
VPHHRRPDGYIVGTGVNVGANHNAGVDVQASYNLGLDTFGWADKGSVQFTFIGAYLLSAEVQSTPGAHTYDCAGLYGAQCQTVNPRWRHTLRGSWQTPWDVLLSAQWRYIGEAKLETNGSDPVLGNGVHDTFDARLKPVSYLDLSGTWNVRNNVVLRAGVNNVFDKDPQIISSLVAQTGSPNAYPTYDLLGRTLFVGLTANF